MRRFLLTLLCLILITCSPGTTEESVSEIQLEETEAAAAESKEVLLLKEIRDGINKISK